MRRVMLATAILFGLVMFGLAVSTASACPLCKNANETNPDLPRAYMYSILFMLAMPATVLTGFGVGFYRLAKKQQAASTDAQLLNGPPQDELDRETDRC